MAFENDSIHAFQRSTPKRSKQPTMADPKKQISDDFIMDTNNSSIVSKRSVEKLYWAGEPEYFRHFVGKFKRRSPLINRGYWLRMKAIDETVKRFLQEDDGEKRKIVVNLGCGYDPLPWLFLGKHPEICSNATFVDVDYPQLMQKKTQVIESTEQLRSVLPEFSTTKGKDGVLAHSKNYYAVGCDLRNLDLLSLVLREQLNVEAEDCSVTILFVAEVSIAYMDRPASQAVIEWAAQYQDVRFCLLEQHLPDGADHPFAQTMLKHFEKLRTPLRAIGTIDQMAERFVAAGWPASNVSIRPLWELWSDDNYITTEERRRLDSVEPFDEWEEFALFASHYFLLVATKGGGVRAEGIDGQQICRNPLSDKRETVQKSDALHAEVIPEPQNHRRFAAIIPALEAQGHSTFGVHAGLGTKERETDCTTFTNSEASAALTGPPLRSGLMCHTITRVGNTSNVLLLGGRGSPDRASPECWLRSAGVWQQVQSLPEGRYRHCAASVQSENGEQSVLVYGGKDSGGRVLESWLMWSKEKGWRKLATLVHPEQPDKSSATPPARFGAVLPRIGSSADGNGVWGLLMGGMDERGKILDGMWRWELRGDGIELSQQQMPSPLLARFGAQTVVCINDRQENETLLVGGIVAQGVLPREHEVWNISNNNKTIPIEGPRPLLVGHCAAIVDEGVLILGGGATCFSFGTYWSQSCVLANKPEIPTNLEYRMLSTTKGRQPPTESLPMSGLSLKTPNIGGSLPKPTSIQPRHLAGPTDFEDIIRNGQPVVIVGHNLGDCTRTWTSDYLKQSVGPDRKVVVHSSSTAKMDFQAKNFSYVTQSFGSFIDAAESGEKLYLRALSNDAPSEEPTTLSRDFPEIAADFQLPQELAYAVGNAHSSPLRISGPVTMWLHYDVMANVLCQVRGSKRLLLYPPSDVANLGFAAGASSSSIDVFNSNAKQHPQLVLTHPHEALLEPGDILFIPSLWLHTAAPTGGLSVAVNVFFRDLNTGYAAGRDVYGNRDLAAYEKGRKDVAKIAKAFDGLPAAASRFYLERLALELAEKARVA